MRDCHLDPHDQTPGDIPRLSSLHQRALPVALNAKTNTVRMGINRHKELMAMCIFIFRHDAGAKHKGLALRPHKKRMGTRLCMTGT